MMRVGLFWILLAVCVMPLFVSSSTQAIEIAIPDDMYEFAISGNGNNGDGYYYLDPGIYSFFDYSGFAVVLDSDGEVVWFNRPQTASDQFGNFGWYEPGYYSISTAMAQVNAPAQTYIYDNNWNLINFVPKHHPTIDADHDSHELYINEDGTMWSLWAKYRTVDLSQYAPYGHPSARVSFVVIELWDWDHNVLWHWDSYDHLDELPFTQRTESDLGRPSIEHLHANSIAELDDGDLLVSARQMSVIFRIDRDTGDVLWRFGGGPANDFTISAGPGIPYYYPLDFYAQHDARQLDNGRFTVYDNGNYHSPSRSYAREYVLDEVNMEAELVWAYSTPSGEYSMFTGSFQNTYDNHRIIGWGTMYPDINVTELDENDEICFQVDIRPAAGFGSPGVYRVRKYESFTPSDDPYLCVMTRPGPQNDLIYCNWFGHEEEIARYEVYGGFTPNKMNLWATTQTGIWTMAVPETEATYYLKARALNSGGQVISPWSNIWKVRFDQDRFDLIPVQDHIAAAGGTIQYEIQYNLSFQEGHLSLYWAELTGPSGETYGPLSIQVMDLPAHAQGTVDGVTTYLPAQAPSGMYTFTGKLAVFGIGLFTSSFYVHKHEQG